MDATELVPITASVRARMPLAEAGHWLLRWACAEERLASIWDRHSGDCYEWVISFGTMVRLAGEALMLHGGSGRRAFEKAIEGGTLDASVTAAFGKLGRLPLAVSQAYLEEGTAAISELVVPVSVQEPRACLRKFQVIVIDGKTIKNVQKRLKPLRQVRGGVIGGKGLVAVNNRTGLAFAMEANPDGDSSENKLVPGLLERIRRRVPGPRVYIADRGFGNLVQAEQFTAEGDHFIARLNSCCKFTCDPDRAPVISRDKQGRKLTETWGVAGSKWNRRRRALRRIELQLAGKATVVIITDLEDPKKYPAAELMETYRERQEIEQVFQKTTEVFGLEHLIGSSPLAGLFQFAYCLLLYNIVRTLLGYVAEANDVATETVSMEKMFDDAQKQWTAWNVMFTYEQTEEYYRELPTRASLVSYLREILSDAWCPTWTKCKPQPNRTVPHTPQKRTHSSAHRLLTRAQEKRPAAKPRGKREPC
jgi:DDE family transposase